MNKKNNRKGFTIVELVIVIAVIAILATVLVPTFGNVISNANATAIKQKAKSIHTDYVMDCVGKKADYENNCWVAMVDDEDATKTWYVQIVNGGVTDDAPTTSEPATATDKILSRAADGTFVKECVASTAVEGPCDWCGKKHAGT